MNTLRNAPVVAALCGFALLALPLAAQETRPAEGSFERAAADLRTRLEESLAELSALRETVAAEKLPLAKKLRELEAELQKTRQEFQQTTRQLDGRTLDLGNLRDEIKKREEESVYLSNLLAEYATNYESRLHIAEVKRYQETISTAKLAVENKDLPPQEAYDRQAKLLDLSLDRLEEALGGARFKGAAADAVGRIHQGTFVLFGPIALFRSDDGAVSGLVEQRLGSLEPSVVPFGDPLDAAAAASLVEKGEGQLPFDATLGNARKIEQTQDTLWEHIKKGGPLMWPIFALAGAALIVVLYKWLTMAFLRKPSARRLQQLLDATARGDQDGAVHAAKLIGGPAGRMLLAGAKHLGEPRELIEETMYEKVLHTKLRLNSMLPFVAISASAAPLLGLLGTVTGIMNTFQLITVFGTGDPKTLSSGISEALITTEYGLIVAIPSLLLHAFLSRKAKGILDSMDKSAVAFLNQVARVPLEQVVRVTIDDAARRAAPEAVAV
jgi:biopolymer transport protein ExbB